MLVSQLEQTARLGTRDSMRDSNSQPIRLGTLYGANSEPVDSPTLEVAIADSSGMPSLLLILLIREVPNKIVSCCRKYLC